MEGTERSEVSVKEQRDAGREREQRLEKLRRLRELGVNPYPYRFQRTHSIQSLIDQEDSLSTSSVTVAAAGRVMSLRKHGHTAFGHIMDDTGKIQFYIRDDHVSELEFKVFKLIDIGDIVGIWGELFRTKTGELTIMVKKLELLSKSLRPLPEKWHGLQNKELRYRRRYLDLIVNDEVRAVFVRRSKIMESMRQYLLGHNFIEVETPILQPIYGGASARPFVTHHNALDIDLYLRIADELYLKRLVVGQMERVFEFAKDFRNEGMDKFHNPEFTMMECYAAYWDYNDMMGFVEEMITTICKEVLGTEKITYGGREIDLSPPWKRLSYYDAVSEKVGKSVRNLSGEELLGLAVERGLEVEGVAGRGEALELLFSELVEPDLFEPTIIMDYPIELSPLAKRHRSEEGLVERFEPFIAGMEIGNAFSELNDPVDQRIRFEEQARLRAMGAEETQPIDEDYIRALEHGMPPTGGLGIGIDRLVMLLTNSPSIRDVILFPQMRPEEGRD